MQVLNRKLLISNIKHGISNYEVSFDIRYSLF